MPNTQHDLAQTLKRLQAISNRCARAFTTVQLKVEYRVAYSAGATLPWRLLETHRAMNQDGAPCILRRMHCFSGAESLERSVQERTTWRAKDQALVASHLVRVRASLQDPSPHDQVSDENDADSSANGGAAADTLTPARQALRAQMCLTVPDRVVDLSANN